MLIGLVVAATQIETNINSLRGWYHTSGMPSNLRYPLKLDQSGCKPSVIHTHSSMPLDIGRWEGRACTSDRPQR